MSKGKNKSNGGRSFKSSLVIWIGPLFALTFTGAIYAFGQLWRWLNGIPGTRMEAPNGKQAQPDRISVTGVTVTTGVVVAALALILWLTWGLLSHWSPRLTQGSPIAPSASQMPNAHAKEDLHTFRSEEDSVLNGYGWEDSAAGKVRIPVAQAMERAVSMGMTLHGDQP